MLSATFSVIILFSFVSGIFTGRLDEMSIELVSSLSDAVSLCISLLGAMCFWTGFMNVLREAGVLKLLSKGIRPLLRFIYAPQCLDDESLENLSASAAANFLGLGNAALPLGMKAVEGLEKDNKSAALCDSTIMLSVLNTVPFQFIPTTLIAMRLKYGSGNPFDVAPYIWLCSLIVNLFAVAICKLFGFVSRRWEK